MGSKYFICRHCRCRCLVNYRLKSGQHYCGSVSCQQARKNKWERDKLGSDKLYGQARSSAKKAWYRSYPGDRYQHFYRVKHPEYVTTNRLCQRLRMSGVKASASEIVKTDALSSTIPFTSGFYELLPVDFCDAKKVVKTDALLVELRTCSGPHGFYPDRGP